MEIISAVVDQVTVCTAPRAGSSAFLYCRHLWLDGQDTWAYKICVSTSGQSINSTPVSVLESHHSCNLPDMYEGDCYSLLILAGQFHLCSTTLRRSLSRKLGQCSCRKTKWKQNVLSIKSQKHLCADGAGDLHALKLCAIGCTICKTFAMGKFFFTWSRSRFYGSQWQFAYPMLYLLWKYSATLISRCSASFWKVTPFGPLGGTKRLNLCDFLYPVWLVVNCTEMR